MEVAMQSAETLDVIISQLSVACNEWRFLWWTDVFWPFHSTT